ncbi:hypothetical protein BDW69DRAFT_155960 [Aspergillus filifer]
MRLLRPYLRYTHLPRTTPRFQTRTMVKDSSTVIDEFNGLVNMSANELRDWLKEEQSTSSGWQNESGSGETIGHESGRKIVSILEHNPSKDPNGYSDEDIDHMRRVVSYCKRHLAQEEKAKQDTGSKSYRSLKNWGHDALKE